MDRTNRTAKKRTRFLAALREHGTVYVACQACGLVRSTVYEWRANDPEFAAAWDEALEDATDVLEREAKRRAAEGVDKPVYQGGELVGAIREYSDTLLIFLLKANRPEKYRDNTNVTMKATHEHSGPNGSAIPIQFFDANAALARIAGGSEADS